MANYDNSIYTYEQVIAGTGYYMEDELLRFSEGVCKMQKKLNTAGFNCGTADGKFGPRTDAEVRKFQKERGLSIDGKAGKNTLRALEGKSEVKENAFAVFKENHEEIVSKYAAKYDIDENLLGGFIIVESSGSGFSSGKVKIRLENHHFLKGEATKYKGIYFDYDNPVYTGHTYRKEDTGAWIKCHQNQVQENDAFDFALSLNEVKAYEAISMGLAQIMGFNYSRCGYSSAKEMYYDFATGEKAQLEGFIKFVISDAVLLRACRNKDYRTIASRYNGKGNMDVYANKIKQACLQYKSN